MTDEGRFDVERRKDICAKRWRVKGGNNLVVS